MSKFMVTLVLFYSIKQMVWLPRKLGATNLPHSLSKMGGGGVRQLLGQNAVEAVPQIGTHFQKKAIAP